jgi:hypothetical protein
MRTTLNIEDNLYKKVKAKAALEGRKVTELIEEGLGLVLNTKNKDVSMNSHKPLQLPTLDRSNGKMLFQGMNVDQIINHLKQLDANEK